MIRSPRLFHLLMSTCGLPFFIIAFQPHTYAASSVYVEPSLLMLQKTVEVPAGELRTVPVQLTEGITVTAITTVSGGFDDEIHSWLVEQEQYEKFKRKQPAEYRARTVLKGHGEYKYLVPKTGQYQILLDNQAATVFGRKVRLYVYTIPAAQTADSMALASNLQVWHDQITSIFMVPEFRLFVRHCGTENAFSNPDITICRELIDNAPIDVPDFVAYHELGHTLLTLWDYPLADNEDVADEFASVAMIFSGREKAGIKAALWFAEQTSLTEALTKILANDRHSISPQRARNIITWLNEGSPLLRRWQKIFVPNMQTQTLQSLEKGTADWIDHELVRGELVKRAALAK